MAQPQELTADEAILKTYNLCTHHGTHSIQKRPYAQLGSVDSKNDCGCCWGVSSDITGAEGQISPVCACSEAIVKEIIEEVHSGT